MAQYSKALAGEVGQVRHLLRLIEDDQVLGFAYCPIEEELEVVRVDSGKGEAPCGARVMLQSKFSNRRMCTMEKGYKESFNMTD